MLPWTPLPAAVYRTVALAGEQGVEWWQVLAQFRCAAPGEYTVLQQARDDLERRGLLIRLSATRWRAAAEPEQLALPGMPLG